MFKEIPETPYGVRKRICFIYKEIERRTSNIKDKRVNPFENVRFERTSVDKLDNQQFDFIICSEVLEHLEDPKGMLNSIRRMLKKEGVCIITIPNGYGPKEMEERIYKLSIKLKLIALIILLKKLLHRLTIKLKLHKQSKTEAPSLKDTLSTESPHIQRFSYRQFKNLLEDCNLSIIKMENKRFLGGPFSAPFLSKSKELQNWNVEIADKLPYFCVSSWMFIIGHSKKKLTNETLVT